MRGMVVIGAGEAGTRAAVGLRERGYAGRVTLIGDEPHPPYERPPLSKGAMVAAADAPPALKPISTREQLAAAGVEFLGAARAAAIDPAGRTVRLADGAVLPYDTLLLATGAAPRRLPVAEAARHCVYFRTYDDAVAIRRRLGPDSRVAVVGGGFIGLELAACARERGAEVVVIEAQPRILTRGVPAEIAAVLHARHEAAGVEILCGEGVTGVADGAETVVLTLSSGRAVAADIAVIGVGAVPATGLAEAAGLALDNGIAVDARLRSSDPHIFAAGDCCSFPLALYGGRRVRLEAWRNAQEQGALAARNMLGAGEAYDAVPWFWSDQHDLGLQIAGLPDEGRSAVRRDLGGGAFVLFHLAADGRLVAASGVGPGTTVARDVRLAQMLIARGAAPSAGDLARPEVGLKSLLSGKPLPAV